MDIGRVRRHQGVCDASAAVFTQRGSTRFLVADDEDGAQTCLRLYEAEEDGPPVAQFQLNHEVLEPDPEEPEIDLEASAWLANRIYWIGSHSRGRKGGKRSSRQRLFATALNEAGQPVLEGCPYTTLISDIEAKFGINIDPKLPPANGGLSIEGLAAMPDGGGLLVGLRSPLFHGRSLLIPFLNPEGVIDKNGQPRFGKPIYLDLGGRGIRSIDYWPARRSYFIIAGPASAGDKGDFVFVRWTGPVSSHPEILDGLGFAELPVDGEAAPEALLIEEASETVYILFDEGNRRVRRKKCKDVKKQSFGSVSVKGL